MKHIKNYKIFETGEWNRYINWQYVKDNPDDGSDEAQLINNMNKTLEDLNELLNDSNILQVIDIKGFDMYIGAYAIVSIFGKRYKVWKNKYDGLFIEDFPINNIESEDLKHGLIGDIYDISEIINDITDLGGDIELYKNSKKYNI